MDRKLFMAYMNKDDEKPQESGEYTALDDNILQGINMQNMMYP